MKKLIYSLALIAVALGFGGCKETWDENPVLVGHEGTITANFLNQPVLKDYPLMITNDNKTGSMLLTCSQPDYGYAAVATYKVQISLTQDFAEYQEISQAFYDCDQIKPVNGDIAAAIEKLSGVKTEADLPLPYQPMYVRLRSFIEQSPNNTEYISNVVSFEKVSADYLAIWVEGVPVNLYIRGGMNDWGGTTPGVDGKPGPWQFMTGSEENTWVIEKCTILANQSIKVSTENWQGINLGGNAGENEDSQMIEAGEEYAMTGGDNPGHMRMDKDFTGKVVLRLEAGVYYIIFDPISE